MPVEAAQYGANGTRPCCVGPWRSGASSVQCAVCGGYMHYVLLICMRCAICSVQCAVCSVQCAVRRAQCAVYDVVCAVCGVQCVVCSVWFAVCGLQFAVPCLQSALLLRLAAWVHTMS